jgi:hypothetical protein
MTLQMKFEKLVHGEFQRIPEQDFESGGKEQLTYLLRAGLQTDSKVLDLACGVLRTGYWLIHLLDPGCYCGIEPHQERLKLSVEHILEPEVRECKRPGSIATRDSIRPCLATSSITFLLTPSGPTLPNRK